MNRVRLSNLVSVAQMFVGRLRYQDTVNLGAAAVEEWWRCAFLQLAVEQGVCCRICYGPAEFAEKVCEGCRCAVEEEENTNL